MTEHTTGKVIVTGTMDAEKLVDYVYRRTKKQARIVPQPADPEPENPAAEEEKKEESGEGDEKPAETGEEEKKEKEENQGKEEDGGGGEEAAVTEERRDGEMAAAEEEGMKRMMYYYQPLYVIERVPPPQLFSDENPNACCISWFGFVCSFGKYVIRETYYVWKTKKRK